MKLVPARLPDNEKGPPDYLVDVHLDGALFTYHDNGMARIPHDKHVRVFDLESAEPVGVWCPRSQKVEQPGFDNGRPIHDKSGPLLLCPYSDRSEPVQ